MGSKREISIIKIITIIAALISIIIFLTGIENVGKLFKLLGLSKPKEVQVILPETNILILNACNHKKAHSILRTKMKEIYPKIIIDVQYNWKARWEMSKTEIYYITKDFKIDAENLEM